jgi:hypothetical protein
MESVLGCSPGETFRAEVVVELVAEFRKLEELSSRLEWLGVRIYDNLDEAIGRLGVELATRREQDAELEALWTSAA